jgi:protein tyrosine kinase modulator
MTAHTPDDRLATGLAAARGLWQRRKWPGLLCLAWAFAAMATVTLTLPGVYEAVATILVEHQDVPDGVATSGSPEAVQVRMDTIEQEILSRDRLSGLIREFDLYPDIRRKVSMEAAVDQLRKDIKLQIADGSLSGPSTATVAFTLGYDGRNPQTVTRVTNRLASFYVQQSAMNREQQATTATAYLKAQLTSVKQKLDAQEQTIQDFSQLHGAQLPEQTNTNLAILDRLNTQLQLNADRQVALMERSEMFDARPVDPGTGADADAEDVSGSVRVDDLKRQLAQLRTRYTDQYPDVVHLKDEIAALEGDPPVAGRAGHRTHAVAAPAPADPADAEMRSLKAEERSLRSQIADYEARVEQAPERAQQLQKLSRDYATTSDIYHALLKQYEEAQLAANLKGQADEQFRVLDAAAIPTIPIGPHRLRLLGLGLLLSLGLAGGVMFLLERLDPSFHDVAALEAFTAVPVLATIPRMVTPRDSWRHRRRLSLGLAGATLVLVLIVFASHQAAGGNQSLVRLLSHPL